jgi:hypothetical protein
MWGFTRVGSLVSLARWGTRHRAPVLGPQYWVVRENQSSRTWFLRSEYFGEGIKTCIYLYINIYVYIYMIYTHIYHIHIYVSYIYIYDISYIYDIYMWYIYIYDSVYCVYIMYILFTLINTEIYCTCMYIYIWLLEGWWKLWHRSVSGP